MSSRRSDESTSSPRPSASWRATICGCSRSFRASRNWNRSTARRTRAPSSPTMPVRSCSRPREQRDAQHYSQLLGTYTAEALSTGTSRPLAWGNGKQASIQSPIDLNKRDHLLLPQEVKELGDQRAIITLTHTKPILCEKARFYADPVFFDRLKTHQSFARGSRDVECRRRLNWKRPPSCGGSWQSRFPRLDLELHRAKVEQTGASSCDRMNRSRCRGWRSILTQFPPVVSRDPPAVDEGDLVGRCLLLPNCNGPTKPMTGISEKMSQRQAHEQQLDERELPEEAPNRLGDRPRLNRDKEERDV
jgi:type IV secretion system protein VirD4